MIYSFGSSRLEWLKLGAREPQRGESDEIPKVRGRWKEK